MRSRFSALLLLVLIFVGCKQEDDTVVYQQQHRWEKKTVAVVAPLSDTSTKIRLERTANWFLNNFKEAQLSDTVCIDLQLEWYDEDVENMSSLSERLANQKEVVAVIGPFSNDHVAAFAPACMKTHKPLIVPTATSEDIIRRYAVANAGKTGQVNNRPFLWALTESDVAFTEMLISQFATEGKSLAGSVEPPKAAMFAPNDTYGQTFFNWVPFQAENLDVDIVGNQKYDNTDDLLNRLKAYYDEMQSQETPFLSATFCVVERTSQLYEVANMRREWIRNNLGDIFDLGNPDLDNSWQLFEKTYQTWFAFSSLSEEGIALLGEQGAAVLQGYQGFSPYADPSTGFELSYESRFGVKPTFAECKFYDALMLAGFASYFLLHSPDLLGTAPDTNEAFNSAVIIISGDTSALGVEAKPVGTAVWSATAMRYFLQGLAQDEFYSFRGASGDIAFDMETYTISTNTTYVHWQLMDGKILHRGYFDSGGKSATAAWKFFYDEEESLDDLEEMIGEQGFAPQYPALTDQYAVLVQGSQGMLNYRHQSDVLSVYQLLKNGGFDDDHIILVMDASLATSPDNNDPNAIRSVCEGENLLDGVVMDYDNAQLSPQDISDILKGKSSERLPVVVKGDATTNVLLFWSGHGRSVRHGGCDEFIWKEQPAGEGFTADLLKQTVVSMSEENSFRKLLVIAEACYSENVIKSVEGTAGALAISGAGGEEQSWAENWNPDLGKFGTWMIDRFTMNVVNALSYNEQASYKDLFLYCTQHTIGSHVKIHNSKCFGNLYAARPKEFFIKE